MFLRFGGGLRLLLRLPITPESAQVEGIQECEGRAKEPAPLIKNDVGISCANDLYTSVTQPHVRVNTALSTTAVTFVY